MEFPDWYFDNHGNEIFLIWKKKLKDKGTIVTREHLREFEGAYRVLELAADQVHPGQKFLKRWFIESTLWNKYMDDPDLEKLPWPAPKPMTPKEAAKNGVAKGEDVKVAAKNTETGTPAVSTTSKSKGNAVKQPASAKTVPSAEIKI